MHGTRASSPVSTGEGGAFFEQHVDALCLALLLVRAPLPVLKDCQIREVHLQAGYQGWSTDDAVVVALGPEGTDRRLAIQAKRQFVVSESNAEGRKTLLGFWSDFVSKEFDPAVDRLALATLRGTTVLLGGLASLLDCARASADEEDFKVRLTIDGFLSKKAREQAQTIRRILDSADADGPTDREFWNFLSVLHVLAFDLNTGTAQTEAWIKTLLAMSSGDADPLAAADATWGELLRIAGAGMPSAASYRHSDLPAALRQRHASVASESARVQRALGDHSAVVLDGIKSTIGPERRIDRADLGSRISTALNDSQVVVVAAPAGFGKSVAAKESLRALAEDHYCFAFRAEEFAVSHIDQALSQAQIPVRGNELLGMLSGQARKLVLVESVERLLEASVRDAFADLLRLARQDAGLGVLLTCRDYSLETVTSALLAKAGLNYSVVEVPPFTDAEVGQAVDGMPGLQRVLAGDGFRRLLRSPYLLDMAVQMDWDENTEVPASAWEFRRQFWAQVVRRDSAAADAMPRRRERAFEELALRRSRQLRPYVPVDDLDAGALEALSNDGLVSARPGNSSMAAPGHDVLEDWAIGRWIERRWEEHEGTAPLLAEDVGGFPATRRAYRIWLAELFSRNAEAAAGLVLCVLGDASIPAFFRDDTLVCSLRSQSVRQFLESSTDALFASRNRLLLRVIHLLRVTCKAPLPGLRALGLGPSALLVPSGDAWAPVLELTHAGLDGFEQEDTPVLLGLVEDFAASISQARPEPPGFAEAAKIAFALLGQLDGYRMEDMRKRALKVITTVPRGDAAAFGQLVARAVECERQDRPAEDLSALLLRGLDSWYACRYFPEEIIELARVRLLLADEDLRDVERRYHGSSVGVEPCFGMRERADFGAFPASSLKGVFLPLLRHHLERAVDFILELLNHAGTWYAKRRWPYLQLEPAWPIRIDVPDGEPITQWANARLWNLYRGHSVGPYALQSALMALETRFLELAKSEDETLEELLVRVLNQSNNVMATGVVASISTAYPDQAGRAGLALLSSRELLALDRSRMVHELGASAMADLLPSFGHDRVHTNERKQSDGLPHRRQDLEVLSLKLQLLEGARDATLRIIDRHREELPPIEEQSEEDKLWRLALHRMDTRGYRPVNRVEATPPDEPGAEVPDGAERLVEMAPGDLEPDIKEIVDRHAPVLEKQERDLSLLNWGRATWEGRELPRDDGTGWEAQLRSAQERDDRDQPLPDDLAAGAPALIAAVCARDHWEEMEGADRSWCLDRLAEAVQQDCDSEDELVQHSRGALRPDRHAAYVLPSLLSRELSADQIARVKRAVSQALTHACDEVVAYAAEGLGVLSQGELRSFAASGLAAIVANARTLSERLEEERTKPYDEQAPPIDVSRELIPAVRASILAQDRDLKTELEGLSLVDWPGTSAASTAMRVLAHQPDDVLARDFYRRMAGWVVGQWEGNGDHRSYDFEQAVMRGVVRFALASRPSQALAVCEPFVSVVGSHPRDSARFLELLIEEEDGRVAKTSFWEVWQAFADALGPDLIQRDQSGRGWADELVRAIFLGVPWKENARHWPRLLDQAHRIDALATQLCGSAAAFASYCSFLHGIGQASLPGAFRILADSLTGGEASVMLSDSNTVFLLETVLGRYVYSEPHRLKSVPSLRDAVLVLLDHLVESGSSAAFRMRDDFVTPIRDANVA